MNLQSGYPFWLIKDGLPYSFPKLYQDLETEVVILGAGISGALMRYYLVNAGINCITVDSRSVGLGSSCASTSLLQYEIDVPLWELSAMIGEEKAQRAYKCCDYAIEKLGKITKKLDFDEFKFKDSLFYAAYKKDVPNLKKEFEARKKAGFKVEYLNENQVTTAFGFAAPAAILSRHGAQTNAYMLTHKLLQYKKSQAAVYDRTPIVKVSHQSQGVTLQTEGNYTIKAKKIIYATGYEVTEMFDKKIVDLKSTYAVISDQYEDDRFWKNNVLLWNTANPYLYLRTTDDRRILVGGRDEDFYNPKKRDALIAKKSKQLVNDFNKLFPKLNFKPEFSWAGTFGETKDGLPYIGAYDKFPNAYFALGFGGNGITFSLMAAEIITQLLLGKQHKDAELFSFNRT